MCVPQLKILGAHFYQVFIASIKHGLSLHKSSERADWWCWWRCVGRGGWSDSSPAGRRRLNLSSSWLQQDSTLGSVMWRSSLVKHSHLLVVNSNSIKSSDSTFDNVFSNFSQHVILISLIPCQDRIDWEIVDPLILPFKALFNIWTVWEEMENNSLVSTIKLLSPCFAGKHMKFFSENFLKILFLEKEVIGSVKCK